MKISPMPSVGNTVGSLSGGADIRKLAVNTNATPGVYDSSRSGNDPSAPADVPPVDSAKINKEADPAIEDTKPLSPQYAALAKQKRALQREREDFERQKAATSTSTVDIARLKSDPLSVLLDNGVTYQQLTDAIIAQQGNPDISALKAEIKALKEGVDQKLTERETQQYQQVVAEMRREADTLATRDDTFELVRETKSVPKVIKLIELTFQETKEVLDVREAMQLIEDELVKESLKLAGYKKVQSRLSADNQQAQTPPPSPQRQQGMRTLTNKDTAASMPMSSKQRALQAFYGQLKK